MTEFNFVSTLEPSDIDGPVNCKVSAVIAWELQLETRGYGVKEFCPHIKSVFIKSVDMDTGADRQFNIEADAVTWLYNGGRGFFPSFLELRDDDTCEITYGV